MGLKEMGIGIGIGVGAEVEGGRFLTSLRIVLTLECFWGVERGFAAVAVRWVRTS